MSDPAEVGTLEAEIIAMLREVGAGQRELTARVGQLDDTMLDFKRMVTASMTGLAQRIVAAENQLESHARIIGGLGSQVAVLDGQSVALKARADAADNRAATLSGRPLWIVAGSLVTIALALLALVVVALLILVR